MTSKPRAQKRSKERDRDSPLGPANLARFTAYRKRKTQTKGATLKVSHISYIQHNTTTHCRSQTGTHTTIVRRYMCK